MNRFLFWGVTLVIFAGCATGDTASVFHDKAFEANPGSLVEFLPAGEKPIHLGDINFFSQRDRIQIPQEYQSSNPPLAYGWKFNFQDLPSKGGQLIISIYNLKPERGCSTIVSLNGKRVKDLSQLQHAAWGSTTLARLSISNEYFRVGENELVIAVRACTGAFRPGHWNHVLIKTVLLAIL